MTNRAVFLDRDGTMAPDKHYCRRPEDFELFPDTARAIKLLNEHDFKVIVVTNQSGIGRGYFTEDTLAKIHEKMKDELAKEGAYVDGIYYCPHHPDANCNCRKPKPELVLQAAKEHEIDLDCSFVVGDLQMDIDLGRAVGCPTILIDSPSAPVDKELAKPDVVVSSLMEAVEKIVAGPKMSLNSADKPDIALITQPLGKGGVPILRNFLELLGPVVGQIYFITGDFPDPGDDSIHILRLATADARKRPLLIRILRLLSIQVKICSHLLKVSSKVTVVIFHIGSDLYLPPMLAAKLLGKKVVRFVVGRHSNFARIGYGRLGVVLWPVFRIIENLSFYLADQINVLSKAEIETMELGKHRHKTVISGAQYIDGNIYRATKPFGERKNLVGYIGGLGPRKGALNFARAIPLVLSERDDIEFLIAGPGSLSERDRIKQELEASNVSSRVRLGDWVPEEEFPAQLNELKLFVLASYEEGLPAVVQQAMACGAVPLTTLVGGLPDLVKDGETGFILEDNSPQTIAKNILQALEYPELGEIAHNARMLIEQEYSYERLVPGCRDAMSRLMRS